MHMTPVFPMPPRQALAAVAVLAVGLLAGCAPTVPDSAQGQGVGFQDYGSYLRNHSAPGAATADAGSYAAPASPYAASQPYGSAGYATSPYGATTAGTGGFSTDAAAAAIDRAAGSGTTASPYATAPAYGSSTQAAPQNYAATQAPAYDATSATRARGNAPAGIAETTSEMNYAGNHAGISDEQDFKAVSSRETIESDKERIARNRAQYQVVEPTAVPNRPAAADVPNIAQYALSTTNTPGQPIYRRGGLRLSDPLAICARFGSNDRAQEAFLAAGGPQRDPKGLDPDGDGFACDWDPRPFRAALQ